MNSGKIFILLVLLCLGMGCASVSRNSKSIQAREIRQETETAVKNVIEAVSGQEVDPKQLQEQIRTDKEAQKALQSISNTMTGEGLVIKYCPVDGKRFSGKFTRCPEHGVLLKEITASEATPP